MSFTSSTDELSLALINAMVNGSSSMNPLAALEAWNNRTNEIAVGVCGFPCMGDCQTCTQSNADLQAFFAPEIAAPPAEPDAVIPRASEASASIEGSSSSTALTDEQWEEIQRTARARDEADEATRTGIWADNGQDYDGPDRHNPAVDDEDDDYRGCHCLDCLNHDDPDYVPSYYDDRDDGCGLDWNESGYFD